MTALLNLDTSVAFLTPVLVYASRSRGQKVDLLLYGCLLPSNAQSVLLPGSNLTNLIVLGHLHISGGHFLVRMAPAWAVAVLVTAVAVGVAERRTLVRSQRLRIEPERPVLGVGIVAVASVTVVVLLSSSPAVPVFGIGLAASAIQVSRRPELRHRVLEALGLPSLIGLFGIAINIGSTRSFLVSACHLDVASERMGNGLSGTLLHCRPPAGAARDGSSPTVLHVSVL
jgi:arsenical pump membrane protein